LQVVVGVAAELVLQVGVQPLVGLGVVADHPLEVARALALQHQLGAAQFAVEIAPVLGVAVEVGDVAVEPVGIGLQQALEGDFGAGDDVDRHLRVGGGRGDGGQQGHGQDAAGEFHGDALVRLGSGSGCRLRAA
jgi:hypothetical protein